MVVSSLTLKPPHPVFGQTGPYGWNALSHPCLSDTSIFSYSTSQLKCPLLTPIPSFSDSWFVMSLLLLSVHHSL